MRISGLADSVSVYDVRVAIQSRTGCSSDNIRVGTIHPGQGGLGAISQKRISYNGRDLYVDSVNFIFCTELTCTRFLASAGGSGEEPPADARRGSRKSERLRSKVDGILRGRSPTPLSSDTMRGNAELEAETRKWGHSREEEGDAPHGLLPPKVASSLRGRSRTPVPAPAGSAFSRVGAYNRARAEGEIVAEEEITDHLEKIRAPMVGDFDSQAPASLQERMSYAVAIINKVATKSTNLRALKDSSATISSVVDALVEDVVRLRAVNERLTEQVTDHSAQFAQLRSRARSEHPEEPKSAPEQIAPSPTPSDAHLRQVIDAVWRLMDGRLAGLEARLPPAPIVRPPLAASQPKAVSVRRQEGRIPVTNPGVTTAPTRSAKTTPKAGCGAPDDVDTVPVPSSSASRMVGQ
ncbi:unnamed protein product [Leptidea sinapis]|uniref:Uncharacterized protein n=1 Tax=Leptidea sinapis TaxID=189913 RepID=A0A5E4PVE6_9NEOP|nr:unnamed protein product [Leptidea sinapis]